MKPPESPHDPGKRPERPASHPAVLPGSDEAKLDATTFEFRPNRAAPPLALEMAKAVFTMGASSCIESYVVSRMLSEGPKVFAFDALTCEALENFDLSVSTADYLQPFPSVVIELPADYTRKRVVPFEEGKHAPDFLIVRHEPEAGSVLVTMHMTSGQVLTRLLKLDPAWTLEEMWQKGQRTWGETDSLGMTQEERHRGPGSRTSWSSSGNATSPSGRSRRPW